jgi:hypothetical protein
MTRTTVDVQTIPGLANTSFSTVGETDEPVIVDRTMKWGEGGYGSHAEGSIAAPDTRWFLAEGATHSNFALYYLIQNPNTQLARVTARFLLPGGQPPLVRTYDVPPLSRFNIYVNDVPASARPMSRPS